MRDFESELAKSDADYMSAAGWDPVKEKREKHLAEAQKKYPKDFNPLPEMLYVKPVQSYIELGTRAGPMKQLFGPFWLLEELAVLYAKPGVGKSTLAVQIAECLAAVLRYRRSTSRSPDARSRRCAFSTSISN